MKKAIILVSLLTIACYVFAQEKGQVFLGISTNLSSAGTGPEMAGIHYTNSKNKWRGSTSVPTNMLAFNLVPRFGYFIGEKLAVGTDLSISYSNISEYDEDRTNLMGGIGLFSRYYLFTEKLRPFFELSGGGGFSRIEGDGFSDLNLGETVFSGLGFAAGLAIPVSRRASLDLQLTYDFIYEFTGQPIYDNKVNGISHNIGLELGMVIYIQRKGGDEAE